ncbi:MAG TPA: DUF2059 domain-containing protein [Candidatus Methylomirabilis sp.]|nr:DUF2059 domain-containing protein [Candidatus Methylomirabilis sp.]
MTTVLARTAIAILVVVLWGSPAMAQADDRRALARDLAHLMVTDALRRELNEQVTTGLTAAVGSTLEVRLSRRLQDQEWRLIGELVRVFISETLVPSRTDEIAAEIYARRFDEAELRELLVFQRSAVGRKAARLGPVIATETAQAINDEIRRSPALPRLVENLQGAFPVLRVPESP